MQFARQHQMLIPLYLHQHLFLQMLSRDVWILAAEAIATNREARLIFMQGLVKRVLRETYKESTSPPSAGTSLAQSVFAGIPSISRGPYPSFCDTSKLL